MEANSSWGGGAFVRDQMAYDIRGTCTATIRQARITHRDGELFSQNSRFFGSREVLLPGDENTSI